MKVQKTGSRISLGHMKHCSGVGKSSLFPCLAILSLFLMHLSLPEPAAAQKKAASSKGRRHAGSVQMGIDVLEAEKFAPLRGNNTRQGKTHQKKGQNHGVGKS